VGKEGGKGRQGKGKDPTSRNVQQREKKVSMDKLTKEKEVVRLKEN